MCHSNEKHINTMTIIFSSEVCVKPIAVCTNTMRKPDVGSHWCEIDVRMASKWSIKTVIKKRCSVWTPGGALSMWHILGLTSRKYTLKVNVIVTSSCNTGKIVTILELLQRCRIRKHRHLFRWKIANHKNK